MTKTQAKEAQSITDHHLLLDWLTVRLLESEPKRPINSGLVRMALDLLDVFREEGIFMLGPVEWRELIDGICMHVVDSVSAPVYPIDLVKFMAIAHGETIEHGEITIEDANRILIEILNFEEEYLRINHVGKRPYLVSTLSCVEAFGIRARVPLHQPERWCSFVLENEDA